MKIDGLWHTSDGRLWVVKELTRETTITRHKIIASILGSPNGGFPDRSDITSGFFLTPRLPITDRPPILRLTSLCDRCGDRTINLEYQREVTNG